MKAISTRKVNTNNGWGFGGWAGIVTTYDNGIEHESGRRYYRHTGSSKHTDWNVPVEEGFRISIRRTCNQYLSSQPRDNVYVYRDGENHRAIVGECKDLTRLFGYTPDNPELSQIIEVN